MPSSSLLGPLNLSDNLLIFAFQERSSSDLLIFHLNMNLDSSITAGFSVSEF